MNNLARQPIRSLISDVDPEVFEGVLLRRLLILPSSPQQPNEIMNNYRKRSKSLDWGLLFIGIELQSGDKKFFHLQYIDNALWFTREIKDENEAFTVQDPDSPESVTVHQVIEIHLEMIQLRNWISNIWDNR